MIKLLTCLKKDARILIRDKVGLSLLFVMPVILVLVITSVQNSAFEMVNNNKIKLLFCNQDEGELGEQFKNIIIQMGMFELHDYTAKDDDFAQALFRYDAMVGLLIPSNFSEFEHSSIGNIIRSTFTDLGMRPFSSQTKVEEKQPIAIYYHPVLQESYRVSVRGLVDSGLRNIENKLMIQSLYQYIGEMEITEETEKNFTENTMETVEFTLQKDGTNFLPNATQHNIPAWTIFALFFMVISLGSALVKEKLEGSFVRLKALPTSYALSILSKQITYLAIALLQVIVIFSIGIWVFPMIDLPALVLPNDMLALSVVTFLSALTAISYAMFIGVFSKTQEQANGIGAVSVVIFAAIGGIMVPGFVLPQFIQNIMIVSPLHWCMDAYNNIFLAGGDLMDTFYSILPLLIFSLLLQGSSIIGLKNKNLI